MNKYGLLRVGPVEYMTDYHTIYLRGAENSDNTRFVADYRDDWHNACFEHYGRNYAK